MKKVIGIAIAFVLLLGACSSGSKKSLNLSSQEILDKMANKETFVVNIGKTTCPACIAYKPVVKELVKNYDVDIYAIMLDTEKDEKATEALLVAIPIAATPTTVIIVDGEVVKKYEGLMEYTDLKKMLVNYDFIKK